MNSTVETYEAPAADRCLIPGCTNTMARRGHCLSHSQAWFSKRGKPGIKTEDQMIAAGYMAPKGAKGGSPSPVGNDVFKLSASEGGAA